MEDRQIKAIDAYINHTARVFGLEPFVVQKRRHLKERKIMLKFAYGVGATLFVIALIFGADFVQKDFARQAEIDTQQAKIDATRYYFQADCHNCSHCDRYHINKGIIVIGTQLSCLACGVEGVIKRRITGEEAYYMDNPYRLQFHKKHFVFNAGEK